MRTLVTILIIILALVGLFFFGISRAPEMLANKLSRKLGVPVKIASMSFSQSEIGLRKLMIGNPPGYSLPRAFFADDMKLQAPITTYLSDNTQIKEIEISDIYLGLEFDSPSGTDGNWTKIFEHFKQHTNADVKDGKKVTIKRLVFNNIHTELLFKSEGGSPRTLPVIKQIVLKDISTEGGVPTDQLMGTVLGQMLKQVFIEQNLQNMIKDLLLDTPGKAVDKFLKPFEGFFNMNPIEDEHYCA